MSWCVRKVTVVLLQPYIRIWVPLLTHIQTDGSFGARKGEDRYSKSMRIIIGTKSTVWPLKRFGRVCVGFQESETRQMICFIYDSAELKIKFINLRILYNVVD